MSLNKPPSFSAINADGTFTVAWIPPWYNPDRCNKCPRLGSAIPGVVRYCECMEAEEPCEITGKRYTYEGEKNRTET